MFLSLACICVRVCVCARAHPEPIYTRAISECLLHDPRPPHQHPRPRSQMVQTRDLGPSLFCQYFLCGTACRGVSASVQAFGPWPIRSTFYLGAVTTPSHTTTSRRSGHSALHTASDCCRKAPDRAMLLLLLRPDEANAPSDNRSVCPFMHPRACVCVCVCVCVNQPQGVDEHPACSPCPHPRYRKAPRHMTLPVLMA